jgi:hypothetical protein
MSTATRPARRTNFARYTPPGITSPGAPARPAQPAVPAPPARVIDAEPAEDANLIFAVVVVGHGRYKFEGVPRDPGADIERLYRLTRLDDPSKIYYVAQHHDHASCDCPDYIFRREGRDPGGCKHVRALAWLGIVWTPETIAVALDVGL